MRYAAGRTTRLKFGMSVLVLPGRNPVVLAKEMATLAIMSGGRLLPAFGLGVADGMEHQAFGVERRRAGEVVRRGAHGDAQVLVRRRRRPRRRALPLRGPQGPAAAEAPRRVARRHRPVRAARVGRIADGWLPSFVTPADAAAGRAVIEQVAAEHEREIEDDHYGVLIPYTMDEPSPTSCSPSCPAAPRPRDPPTLVPVGWDAVIDTVKRFVDVGTTKFVVLPIVEPPRTGTPTWPPPPTPSSPSRRERVADTHGFGQMPVGTAVRLRASRRALG